MPRLFWPNFDFEHELAAGENWQPSQKLRDLNARFAPVLGALCYEDDVVVLPEKPIRKSSQIGPVQVQFVSQDEVKNSSGYAGRDWELIPWGVTSSLQRLAERRNWTWRQPSLDVVRRLNDRLTSSEWEQQWKVAPDDVATIQNETVLTEALKQLPTARWVIKARFGMSARERIVGEGLSLSKTQAGWLRKRLAEQQAVILEPWLDAVSEAGLQFDVPQSGTPRCLAVLPLLNSETGEYRGSRLSLTEGEQNQWQPAVEIGAQIAAEAQSRGYFGPLGIDAMLYRVGAEVRLRPLQDINARWTMGRIAWEWAQRLAPGENATWMLGTAAHQAILNPPTNLQVIPTSPGDAESVPSALLIEDSQPNSEA